MSRQEPRTPNTAACPDERHHHRWIRRRPELTLGTDRLVAFDADARGVVEITEEALMPLLRLGGFVPEDTTRAAVEAAAVERQTWERPHRPPTPGDRVAAIRVHLDIDARGRAYVHEAVLAELFREAGWERTA